MGVTAGRLLLEKVGLGPDVSDVGVLQSGQQQGVLNDIGLVVVEGTTRVADVQNEVAVAQKVKAALEGLKHKVGTVVHEARSVVQHDLQSGWQPQPRRPRLNSLKRDV